MSHEPRPPGSEPPQPAPSEEPQEAPEPTPLLTLRDGLPPVI